MFFTIDRELFSKENIDTKYLNKIWHVCIDQHSFYQSKEDDIEATESSAWYKDLSEVDKKLWEESVLSSIQMGNKYDKVKVFIGNTHTPFEAFHFLSAPLSIILENSRNDVYFLKALFRCFRQDSKLIQKNIQSRFIKFVLGGGSSIAQVIETEMESFNSVEFTKEAKEYLRFFVILDSDKEYPSQPLKTDKLRLLEFLAASNVPYHILEKREMENYVPDIAFRDITHNVNFIEAYLRLSPEQKDYFDLENGFKNVNFSGLSEEVQQLFDSISDQDKETFRRCDMKKFTGSAREDFKSEFPKLFNLESIDKVSLVSRTQHQQSPGELVGIINKIKGLL